MIYFSTETQNSTEEFFNVVHVVDLERHAQNWPEVRRWLEEEIQSSVYINPRYPMIVLEGDHGISRYVYRFMFENNEDAVAFKLRWQ